jgi:hypothetical protein
MDDHYSYEEEQGGVILLSPDGESVFLQPGDDSGCFLAQVAVIDEIWEKNPEGPNPEAFPTYEDHLDVLIDPYF